MLSVFTSRHLHSGTRNVKESNETQAKMTASVEPCSKVNDLENEIADLEQRLAQARAKRSHQLSSTSSLFPKSPIQQLTSSQQPFYPPQ